MTKLTSKLRPIRDTHPELPLDPDAFQPGLYKWPPHFNPPLQAVVFIGGSFGTLARYGISVLIPTDTNGWPTATLIVNFVGAFFLGFLLEALSRRGPDKGRLRVMRLGIGTGFIGGFTTYSTFSVEAAAFFRDGHFVTTFAYIATTLIGGMICSALGIVLAIRHHKQAQGVVA